MSKAGREKVLNTKELRATLKEVVASVRQGHRFTVLYRSRPAFRIVPLEDEPEELADVASDPLYRAGALACSDGDDLADRHDEYLYGS